MGKVLKLGRLLLLEVATAAKFDLTGNIFLTTCEADAVLPA